MNVLKKIIFTFDEGRFELFNNKFNYILGNDYSVGVDLDFTSTLKMIILKHIFHFIIVAT